MNTTHHCQCWCILLIGWWSWTAQFERDHPHFCSFHKLEMDDTTITMIGMGSVFNLASRHLILICVQLWFRWTSQGPIWWRYWQTNPIYCPSDCQKVWSNCLFEIGSYTIGWGSSCHFQNWSRVSCTSLVCQVLGGNVFGILVTGPLDASLYTKMANSV